MILDKLFQVMAERHASDIFVSAGAPIHIKIQGSAVPVNQQVMEPAMIEKIAQELMTPEQAEIFGSTFFGSADRFPSSCATFSATFRRSIH